MIKEKDQITSSHTGSFLYTGGYGINYILSIYFDHKGF